MVSLYRNYCLLPDHFPTAGETANLCSTNFDVFGNHSVGQLEFDSVTV